MSGIGNWSMIILVILCGFLFLLAFILSSDSEDIPRDDNRYISKESWAEARKQMKSRKW